ncbi:transposase [Vibrio sp. SS-MA-C1-2]|uniref:transposase n=1 Tax=Vibrio sp. SS-MA-C1-2 TaxID=2908646 RepID=UPI001F486B11|nr:transposase [Vibrio sp. SS-MA-C1-2]UJF19181.1 transposase [Vibrio sp. SS-MA-C1-2]
MTIARRNLVSIDATPYYHCVSRCVRRSFLCGFDHFSQKSYEHRRHWIERKISELSQIYCIDICAYAIMSNHYHLVLHLNQSKAVKLSDIEVVERWQQLHHLPRIVERWLAYQLITPSENEICMALIQVWRERLVNLSWFMRELNYEIALRANKEDDCKGHFWESRFKSQALLDEKALIAAMAYVDLNPVRAGVNNQYQEAEFTSIKLRLEVERSPLKPRSFLYPFVGTITKKDIQGIPFNFIDYIELLDWNRHQENTKTPLPSSPQSSPLKRLGINEKAWVKVSTRLERFKSTAVGSSKHIEKLKLYLQKRRINLLQLDY